VVFHRLRGPKQHELQVMPREPRFQSEWDCAIACCCTVFTSLLEMIESGTHLCAAKTFASHWKHRFCRSPVRPCIKLYLSHDEQCSGMSATLRQRITCASHTARQTANFCLRSSSAYNAAFPSAAFIAAWKQRSWHLRFGARRGCCTQLLHSEKWGPMSIASFCSKVFSQ
jgi:hypothetical protein